MIPALDEEAALPGVIARIPDWVDRIVVVDNGSTDDTARVARAAGAEVAIETRRGYGRACLTGIDAADASEPTPHVLVFLDADGSDDPSVMGELVDPILEGRADLVIGSRMRGTAARGAMTPPQRFGNLLAPALLRSLWGRRDSDPTTDLGPFRAIRRAPLASLQMDDAAFGWTVQMQIRALRQGLRTMEVPVDYGRRRGGRSKISGTVRGVAAAGATILGCVARERLRPPSLPARREALAVFAKHPTPGLAKTRLIPALGADGAAKLHERMVRRTLAEVDRLARERGVVAEIRVTGAAPEDFAHALDATLPCNAQCEGDLGARMLDAMRGLLASADAAVIVGTDCPELSSGVLHAAFDALRDADLVLGPARDGGYYLIGLRRPAPSLFTDIAWSTDLVLASTLERARSLGLRVRLLPTLADVDEPADLAEWEAVASETVDADPPALSVVIPTLGEANRIAPLVASLRRPGVEVIVADGGSEDGTRALARAAGARVVLARPGRGPQLNEGAATARGERLLFLHADTMLPADFATIVAVTLAEPAVALGAFRFALDRRSLGHRLIEWGVRFRCATVRTPYGDQALFLRRATFDALGGFAPFPLLEDLDLVRRARRFGRIVVVPEPAITSARRWDRNGLLRTIAVHRLCAAAYLLGIAPERIAAWRARKTPDRIRQIDAAGSGTPNASRAASSASAEDAARK